jgi:proline dehydrogenase
MSFLDGLLSSALPYLPKGLLWKVARRYIAGASMADALRVVDALGRAGCRATVDVLGEDVRGQDASKAARDAYLSLLDALHQASAPAGISVKLSQLGARLSPELAFANVAPIVERACAAGRFVRLDMEDSSMTSLTLDLYRRLLAERGPETGSRLGVVLQAYLKRSPSDARSLLPLRPEVRLCKGIYREPPAIALTDRQAIREQFVSLLDILIDGGARVAVATHDPPLVDAALDRLGRLPAAERRCHEFQMLLGVGETIRPRIQAAGMRLRIYVPFGPHWHAYSIRRLRENPTIARYVIYNLLRSH